MGTKPSPEALNAVNLKQALWETLNDIRNNDIDAANADAIACQAREILRTTRTQLAIQRQAKIAVSPELVRFASPPDGK